MLHDPDWYPANIPFLGKKSPRTSNLPSLEEDILKGIETGGVNSYSFPASTFFGLWRPDTPPKGSLRKSLASNINFCHCMGLPPTDSIHQRRCPVVLRHATHPQADTEGMGESCGYVRGQLPSAAFLSSKAETLQFKWQKNNCSFFTLRAQFPLAAFKPLGL